VCTKRYDWFDPTHAVTHVRKLRTPYTPILLSIWAAYNARTKLSRDIDIVVNIYEHADITGVRENIRAPNECPYDSFTSSRIEFGQNVCQDG
jgi:hypothetical protein